MELVLLINVNETTADGTMINLLFVIEQKIGDMPMSAGHRLVKLLRVGVLYHD